MFCAALAALAAGTLSAAPLTVEFRAGEPLKLENLRRESYQGVQFGDSDRLVISGNGEKAGSVTLDSRAFGRESFGDFECRALTHGSLNASPASRLIFSGSENGVDFSPLTVTAGGRKGLTGGYSMSTLHHTSYSPVRYLRIEFRDLPPGDYWKLQLASLLFPEPPPECYERELVLKFTKEAPLKLENLRQESYQGQQFGLESPRLVLQNADTGAVTADLANYPGARAFRELTLKVVAQSALKGNAKEHLVVQASNDGRTWVPLELAPAGKARGLTGGYRLETFTAKCDRPYRFVSARITGVPGKLYWHLQLAELTLKVNGKAASPAGEPVPQGKRFDAPSPAAGARIALRLHTLGLEKAKLFFFADGVKLSPRQRDGAADGGGWRERTVEVWSDKPFRTLQVAASTEPEWAVQLGEVKFINDRAAYEREMLGPVPSYRIGKESPVCSVDRIYASYLQSPDAVKLEIFDSVKWGAAKLDPSGFRAPNWNGLSILREPGREVLATLYRFRLAADFDPEKEDLVFTIPQSAFTTTIYLDGKKIANYHEGFLPVSTLLTDAMQPGREHEVVIKVEGYRSAYDSKGRVLFPIGAMAPWTSGITQPPVFEKRAKLRAENLFVRSTPDAVAVSAEIHNGTASMKSGKAAFIVTDAEGRELLRSEIPFRVSAGTSAPVEAVLPADGRLKKWDIGEPNLYFAHVEFDAGSGRQVSVPVRFGFRTVELRGDSLFLNGRKIRLRGPWAHIGEWTFRRSYEGRSLNDRELFETLLANGLNAGRLHCQPFNRAFYDAADEAGFLIIAEAALAHRPANQASLEHIDRFVRTLRNHPSIVIWSGSNEFEHWITPRPRKTMDFLLEVQNRIKALDPSRPVQHSGFGDAWGKLDIYNIHYPADNKGFPRTLYWTRNPSILPNKLYRENFTSYNPVGKKPLAYGEERIPGDGVDLSMLFGETALRARLANTPEGKRENLRMLARDWALRTRAEREQNVLLFCPNIFYVGLDSVFVKELSRDFRDVGAYPKFCNPVLQAGKKAEIPVVLFEDSGRPFRGSVKLELVSESGAPVAGGRLDFNSPGGTLAESSAVLDIPENASGKAKLVTTTCNSEGAEVFRDETEFLIAPPADLPQLEGTLHVWGELGELASFAKRCGLRLAAVSSPEQLKSARRPALWVSPSVSDVELQKYAKTLADLVAAGGRVILAERVRGTMCLPSDAIWNGDSEAISCIGFVRGAHPVTEGIDDLELRYWERDFALTDGVTGKPENGNFRILVDGGANCAETYLWELPFGKGFYLVNHLKLTANAVLLPQAEKLLHRLISYALSAPETRLEPGAVLGADEDFSAGILLDAGWKSAAELPEAETLAITGEALRKLGTDAVAKAASRARNILVFNAPEAVVGKLSSALAGAAPGTEQVKLQSGDRFYFSADDELFNGITSADLNWAARAELPYRFVDAGPFRSSIAHGADAVCRKPDGGVVLFLNLPLDRDVPSAGTRARFLSQLATNLNVQLEAKKVKNHDPDAVRNTPVDLGPIVNASRATYFGKPFPSGNVVLCGIPFRLPVASREQSTDFFRFNARRNFKGTLEFDTPIDRFTTETPERVKLPLARVQAESIFFLHGANRNWKLERFRSGSQVGEYRILFEDGSSTRIPLIFGENIGCVRGSLDPVPRAKLAGVWQMPPNGDGESAAAFVYEWENPTPEKKIVGIELVNGCNVPHDLFLFAVTLREPVAQYQ